jgi:hypothetical protein
VVETARTSLLHALRSLPRGAGLEALRGLAPLLEDSIDADREDDPRLPDAFIRVLGPILGEHTPLSPEDALALLLGVDPRRLVTTLPPLRAALAEVRALQPGLTRDTVAALTRAEALLSPAPETRTRAALAAALETPRARLAAELARLHAPVPVTAGEALPIARWLLDGGPAPRGAAVLTLARELDAFCHRAPLGPRDLEALRELARAADAEHDTPGWRPVLERLRTLRPRLLPVRAHPPLYRSLAGAPSSAPPQPSCLVDVLR